MVGALVEKQAHYSFLIELARQDVFLNSNSKQLYFYYTNENLKKSPTKTGKRKTKLIVQFKQY